METFSAPVHLTIAFTLLTFLVACVGVLLVRKASPPESQARWMGTAVLVAIVWLAANAGIAESGVLEGDGFPPPVVPYLAVNFLAAFAVLGSRVGKRLAQLPLIFLVGLQAFRLPVEVMLHELYEAGSLPVQMTWSGLNFDVVTAITAILLAVALRRGAVPNAVLWAWNILGLGLLLTVVVIALLSAPLPIRQFHNEPAMRLVFHAPYNWIVSVHVWTALVGHLVVFRALWGRRAKS